MKERVYIDQLIILILLSTFSSDLQVPKIFIHSVLNDRELHCVEVVVSQTVFCKLKLLHLHLLVLFQAKLSKLIIRKSIRYILFSIKPFFMLLTLIFN
jgi:hypothetical protein